MSLMTKVGGMIAGLKNKFGGATNGGQVYGGANKMSGSSTMMTFTYIVIAIILA